MKKNKGITLIALVITIIVLLILAGVAISMLSGENGILRKTADAKTETEKGTFKEIYKIKLMGKIGEDVDKLALLKEAVEESGMQKEFDYTTDLLYTGKDEEIKELTIEAVCDDLVKKGFLISCVEGETFITGVTDKTESYNKLKEIKDSAGNQKYIVEKQDGTSIEEMYTGYIVKFNNDSKTKVGTIIFYNGDINLDGTIGLNGQIQILEFVSNPIKYITSYKPKMYQIYSMDIDHNGIIDKNDGSIFGAIAAGNTKGINNNIKLKKIDTIDKCKEMTDEELITLWGISKNKDYTTEFNEENGTIYLIELNKTYTYQELTEKIKDSTLNNVKVEFYDLEENEIDMIQNSNDNMVNGYIMINNINEGAVKEDSNYQYYKINSCILLKY